MEKFFRLKKTNPYFFIKFFEAVLNPGFWLFSEFRIGVFLNNNCKLCARNKNYVREMEFVCEIKFVCKLEKVYAKYWKMCAKAFWRFGSFQMLEFVCEKFTRIEQNAFFVLFRQTINSLGLNK